MSRIRRLIRNLRYLSKTDLRNNPAPEFTPAELINNILYYIHDAAIVRPNVMNATDTLDMLCNTNKSIARFGDGEIYLINGSGIPYQEYDPELAQRMRDMLKNTDKNIMIGINYSYFYPIYNPVADELTKSFQLITMPKCREKLLKMINVTAALPYCDAGFTALKREKSPTTEAFFAKMRTIWENKDIVLVHNAQLHAKIKHDIFDNAANTEHVYVPNLHSFREYKPTLEKLTQYPTNRLIILMAGPLSKVLVADLSKLGYRALDLGHIAKSYDWYYSDIEITSDNVGKFFSPDL